MTIVVRKHPKTTVPQMEQIERLAADGWHYMDIAAQVDCPAYRVQEYCVRHGIDLRAKPTQSFGSQHTAAERDYERKVLGKLAKPGALEYAKLALQSNLRIDHNGNYLWTNGNWWLATIDEIMRRTNAVRKRDGMAQILTNPRWEVSCDS